MQETKDLFQKKLDWLFLDMQIIMQIQFCFSGKNWSGGVLVHSQDTAGLVGHCSAAALCCDAGEREMVGERKRERESNEGEKERERWYYSSFQHSYSFERETPKKLEFAVSLTFNMLLWLQMLLGPLGDKFGPRKTFGACLFLSALSMVRLKTGHLNFIEFIYNTIMHQSA